MLDPSLLSSSPPLPSEASLRLGTFNVGLGFQRKLPALIHQCASLELDAVAVQEIGDPALLHSRFPPYHLLYSAGPSHHQAGVGLLLSLALVPRIRRCYRPSGGRVLGVVLELSKGHQLLLVSAYMPTGLDHRPLDSPEHEHARSLYHDILQWSVGVQQVCVMGDLNETHSYLDRLPRPPAAHAAAAALPRLGPIRCLQQDGFLDAWRSMHPSAPGFTHSITGEHARASHSRIDYVWCKGIHAADLLQVQISSALHALSHHRLLWVQLRMTHAVPSAPPALAPPLRLPNLRDLDEAQKNGFSERLDQAVSKDAAALHADLAHADAASLSRIASHLTRLVRRTALATLPCTGDKPFQSRCVLQLQRQRSDLTRLLRMSESLLCSAPDHLRGHTHCFVQSVQWSRLQQRCIAEHHLHWAVDAWYAGDAEAWLAETRQLLRSTRSSIHTEQRRMLRERKPPADSNPAAFVHRILRSDALPAQLLSVVNKDGQLTSTAEEVKEVIADPFRSVFSVPPADAAPLPQPFIFS